MRLILDLILAACVLYGLWFAATRYAKADGTQWQRILAIGAHSATMAWSWLLGIAGAGIEAVPGLVDWFTGEAAVSEAVKGFLKPEYVPVYVIAISGVTALARWRSMKAA